MRNAELVDIIFNSLHPGLLHPKAERGNLLIRCSDKAQKGIVFKETQKISFNFLDGGKSGKRTSILPQSAGSRG